LRQAAVVADMEKRGFPSVLESWEDPLMNMVARNSFLKEGVPECRQVLTPPDTAITDLSDYVPDFVDALTRPLTEKEASSGMWTPAVPPRIAMTGTLDEVQTYFQGDLMATPMGGPYAWMTDGGPVIPPTEERVAMMLMGTSHSPDEIFPFGGSFGVNRVVTVEKIAINAVMAGCRPEYMPVVMAIAETGGSQGYPGDASYGHMYVVSGPIAKEIGMNCGFGFLCPNNPADTALERASALMGLNLGGFNYGFENGERSGNVIWGKTFAEDPNTPWETINVDLGYNADESILLNLSGHGCDIQGGIQTIYVGSTARPADLFELQVGNPELVADVLGMTGANIFLISKDAADTWKNIHGFDSIQELQDYFWDNATWPAGMWYTYYFYASRLPSSKARYMAREPGTRQLNPDHMNLPADVLIPRQENPDSYWVIVAGGTGPSWGFGVGSRANHVTIDKWR